MPTTTCSPAPTVPVAAPAVPAVVLDLRRLDAYRLNLAEGCGHGSRPAKAHFYLIARGSTMESAAALDVLLARGLVTPALHRLGHGLLVRVVQMLTRLAQRMQSAV